MKFIDNVYCMRYINKHSLKRGIQGLLKKWIMGSLFVLKLKKILGMFRPEKAP